MANRKSHPILIDIRPPQKRIIRQSRPKISRPKYSVWYLAGIAFGGILLIIFANFWYLTVTAQTAFGNIKSAASSLKISLRDFRLDSVNQEISLIKQNLQKVFKTAGYYLPASTPIYQAIKNSYQLSDASASIADNLEQLQKNGVGFLTQQRGAELIGILERMEDNLAILEKNNKELKKNMSQLGSWAYSAASFSSLLKNNYAPVQLTILRGKDFLRSSLNLLRAPEDRHILLIFQNQSEIRPAGGFIGSYGDLVLNGGNLKELKIDDIYNADRQLPVKIIPPSELRPITVNWGARDANWFFDFPTSAEKVISFLEKSDLFSLRQIQFQGAIAINTNVLQTLLEAVGPIALADYDKIIDSGNFLSILQREVESGRDKKPGQNPKKILSVLAPKLLEKLGSLDKESQRLLLERFKKHLTQKDIMIYFRDWGMENFLQQLGMAGQVWQSPKDFSGDYLAVVNANIAGGKTDAFIQQHINLKSKIQENGTVIDELAVTRSHSGQQEKDWWYTVTNKDYLKIFVPEKSELISLLGNDPSLFNPPAAPKGYKSDSDLDAIEKKAIFLDSFRARVGKEFGKTFFGSWFSTGAGETKTLSAVYENGVHLQIKDGMRYEFIFEKQSGVDGSLEYSITAPPGYIWKESGKSVFEYGTEQIQGREVIELTLVNPHT